MAKKISRLETILERAAGHHGGMEALREKLPTGILDPKALSRIPDHRHLAGMTRAVFKAGFVWRVIENKWPGFEEAFHRFDVDTCAFLAPEDIEELCTDERIVRNRQKILTVPRNAAMIRQVAAEHGSFAAFIAGWPDDDYVGLLDFLRKHGERLGGNSAQYYLRAMGKDGFLVTKDVTQALIDVGVVDGPPGGKTALRKVQEAFNAWRGESGMNQAQISRVLAMSIG